MAKFVAAIRASFAGAALVAHAGLGMAQTGQHSAQTTALDPHQVYEMTCNSCHSEHGADLARQMLAIKGDKLVVSRTGRDFLSVIRAHHGVKPTAAEIAALSLLFRNGILWGGVFQHRCASCHGRAVGFARANLKIDGDKVVISKDGRDVGVFLSTHGDATSGEIATLIAMMKFQLASPPVR